MRMHRSAVNMPSLAVDGRMIRTFHAYAPFGGTAQAAHLVLAFNGEFRDRFTGNYLLGNGKRTYSPGIRRFTSADKLSPFSQGGINAYVYCLDDPINRLDPSGEFSVLNALKNMVWLGARVKNLGWSGGSLKVMSEAGKWLGAVGGVMVTLDIPYGKQVITTATIVKLTNNTLKIVPYYAEKALERWGPDLRPLVNFGAAQVKSPFATNEQQLVAARKVRAGT